MQIEFTTVSVSKNLLAGQGVGTAAQTVLCELQQVVKVIGGQVTQTIHIPIEPSEMIDYAPGTVVSFAGTIVPPTAVETPEPIADETETIVVPSSHPSPISPIRPATPPIEPNSTQPTKES